VSAAIIAFSALSGLGRGDAAIHVGEVGEVARVVTEPDEELAAAKLGRPFCARVPVKDLPRVGEDRATAILRAAMNDIAHALDACDATWRSKRVGLALATSSGGMRSAEELFRALRGSAHGTSRGVERRLGERATYFGPMKDVVCVASGSLPRFAPTTLVLTACSASTIAIGLALGWLERDACDLVLAGGFDAVSVFVASGFETLRATTAKLPSRPFSLGRDGMALGEGAALLALTRQQSRFALGYVTGFGASGDAVHVTAPDRTGAGLARAAKLALGGGESDGASDIDIVSAHGTATPFNDAAEWKAIVQAIGPRAADVVVHPFKAQVGHTLGAAGAIESLAALDAMRRGVLPASVISAPRDPETPARLLERSERGTPRAALKLSAAFGGANASLVVRATPGPTSRGRVGRAYMSTPFYVGSIPNVDEVSKLSGTTLERLARADELVFLALAAVAGLRRAQGALDGAGVVVGHAYATVDVNDRYFQRVLERGDARAAEPRRFPYTSPNAVAGECSVAYNLTGPNLAVGSGLHGGVEALAIAADLVRAGDAERMVAVAVDAPRRAAHAIGGACGWPVPRDGAVAILVSSAPIGPEIVATETATLGAPDDMPHAPGHEALLSLLSGGIVAACGSPWGAFARVVLASQLATAPGPP
jgi:3-oxoacyl-[acyl-carrier-protein] synthase-1/3-oxoacyl-[acyl-carrier-protein] synthase II